MNIIYIAGPPVALGLAMMVERRRVRELKMQQQEELNRREEEYMRREEELERKLTREVLLREEERKRELEYARREREHVLQNMRLERANGILEGKWQEAQSQRAERERVDAARARQEAERARHEARQEAVRARREAQQRLLEEARQEDAKFNAMLQSFMQHSAPPQSGYRGPWGH